LKNIVKCDRITKEDKKIIKKIGGEDGRR